MKMIKMLIGTLSLSACAVASFACTEDLVGDLFKPNKLYTQTEALKRAIGSTTDCVQLAEIINKYVEDNEGALVDAGKDLASISANVSAITDVLYTGVALGNIHALGQRVDNCDPGGVETARQDAKNALGSLTSLEGWGNALTTAAEYEENKKGN